MSNLTQLISDNIHLLTQLREFISGLTSDDYAQDNALLDSGTIGAHNRHILEHYDALINATQPTGTELSGTESTGTQSTETNACEKLVIDYDARARNTQLEQHPEMAKSEIERVCAALTQCQLTEQNTRLKAHDVKFQNNDLLQPIAMTTTIRCSTNVNTDSAAINSTLQRELVFLHSHTTHHMAIIRILATALGHNVDKGFGKAASTQQFENQSLPHQLVSHV